MKSASSLHLHCARPQRQCSTPCSSQTCDLSWSPALRHTYSNHSPEGFNSHLTPQGTAETKVDAFMCFCPLKHELGPNLPPYNPQSIASLQQVGTNAFMGRADGDYRTGRHPVRSKGRQETSGGQGNTLGVNTMWGLSGFTPEGKITTLLRILEAK